MWDVCVCVLSLILTVMVKSEAEISDAHIFSSFFFFIAPDKILDLVSLFPRLPRRPKYTIGELKYVLCAIFQMSDH